MRDIEVEILDSNIYQGMPQFLAKLTQRGHEITEMRQLWELFDDNRYNEPSDYFMTTPHTTLRRMNYITVAIVGLSTKCVSQLRTHAKRLTFISTSTQYSNFSQRENNCIIPTTGQTELFKRAYDDIQKVYKKLIVAGVDKDDASYVLPQGLRKALVVSGNLDDWQYVIRTRLCNRNSKETQHVAKLIYDAIADKFGRQFVLGMLPPCVDGKCQEGKKCCGRKLCISDL